MKNTNAILPKAQELNESIRNPLQIAGIPLQHVMIEPKFDGSFVYITKDRSNGQTIMCTKDGNQLNLEPAVQEAIITHFSKYECIFEAELEPAPWAEERKTKLNGNLYSGVALPFHIRLVVHDMLPISEVNEGTTPAWQRYCMLCSMAQVDPTSAKETPRTWLQKPAVSIQITPCKLVTPAVAADMFNQGWAEGKNNKRVMFHSEPYEGLVAINPDSTHKAGRNNKWKFKPFHSLDIEVTGLQTSNTGKTRTFRIDGKDTKTQTPVSLYTGISPTLFSEIEQATVQYKAVILEIEALAIKSLQHANPTVKAIRYDRMVHATPTQAPDMDM